MRFDSERVLFVSAVQLLGGHRLALQLESTKGYNVLQYVYRAARSVYWEPETKSFEDRYQQECSSLASFRRIRGAVREELGIELEPSRTVTWVGLPAPDRAAIEEWWTG